MYQASAKRYETMKYHYCGNSGLKLPAVSFGLWHNFGDNASYDTMKELCFTAFDNGITHFDLANNYGPAYGSAETKFRENFERRTEKLPRRTSHQHESRLRYVGRTVLATGEAENTSLPALIRV